MGGDVTVAPSDRISASPVVALHVEVPGSCTQLGLRQRMGTQIGVRSLCWCVTATEQ